MTLPTDTSTAAEDANDFVTRAMTMNVAELNQHFTQRILTKHTTLSPRRTFFRQLAVPAALTEESAACWGRIMTVILTNETLANAPTPLLAGLYTGVTDDPRWRECIVNILNAMNPLNHQSFGLTGVQFFLRQELANPTVAKDLFAVAKGHANQQAAKLIWCHLNRPKEDPAFYADLSADEIQTFNAQVLIDILHHSPSHNTIANFLATLWVKPAGEAARRMTQAEIVAFLIRVATENGLVETLTRVAEPWERMLGGRELSTELAARAAPAPAAAPTAANLASHNWLYLDQDGVFVDSCDAQTQSIPDGAVLLWRDDRNMYYLADAARVINLLNTLGNDHNFRIAFMSDNPLSYQTKVLAGLVSRGLNPQYVLATGTTILTRTATGGQSLASSAEAEEQIRNFNVRHPNTKVCHGRGGENKISSRRALEAELNIGDRTRHYVFDDVPTVVLAANSEGYQGRVVVHNGKLATVTPEAGVPYIQGSMVNCLKGVLSQCKGIPALVDGLLSHHDTGVLDMVDAMPDIDKDLFYMELSARLTPTSQPSAVWEDILLRSRNHGPAAHSLWAEMNTLVTQNAENQIRWSQRLIYMINSCAADVLGNFIKHIGTECADTLTQYALVNLDNITVAKKIWRITLSKSLYDSVSDDQRTALLRDFAENFMTSASFRDADRAAMREVLLRCVQLFAQGSTFQLNNMLMADARNHGRISLLRQNMQLFSNDADETIRTLANAVIRGLGAQQDAASPATADRGAPAVTPVPAPAVVTPVPAPAVVTPVPAPAVVTPVPAPAVVTPVPAPAVVTPVPAPAAVTPVPAPAVVTPVPAPAAVTPVPAPAAVTPVPAPAVVTPVPAPAVVTPVPAPAYAEDNADAMIEELTRAVQESHLPEIEAIAALQAEDERRLLALARAAEAQRQAEEARRQAQDQRRARMLAEQARSLAQFNASVTPMPVLAPVALQPQPAPVPAPRQYSDGNLATEVGPHFAVICAYLKDKRTAGQADAGERTRYHERLVHFVQLINGLSALYAASHQPPTAAAIMALASSLPRPTTRTWGFFSFTAANYEQHVNSLLQACPTTGPELMVSYLTAIQARIQSGAVGNASMYSGVWEDLQRAAHAAPGAAVRQSTGGRM